MSTIDELAAEVRALIEQDQEDIRTAWNVRTGFSAERLATMQGTTVLMSGWRAHREVELRRALLARVLAEPHGLVDADDPYPCPRRGTSARCQCGRDERVLGHLQLLAQPYREAT